METKIDSRQSLIAKVDVNIMKEVDPYHHHHPRDQNDPRDLKNLNNISPRIVVDCLMKLETVANNYVDTITTLNMAAAKSLLILVAMEIQITLRHPRIVNVIVHMCKVSSFRFGLNHVKISYLTTTDRCSLRPHPGRCSSNETRYYYDSRANGCYPFTYTGCQGNTNNFFDKQECERACYSRQPDTETRFGKFPLNILLITIHTG